MSLEIRTLLSTATDGDRLSGALRGEHGPWAELLGCAHRLGYQRGRREAMERLQHRGDDLPCEGPEERLREGDLARWDVDATPRGNVTALIRVLASAYGLGVGRGAGDVAAAVLRLPKEWVVIGGTQDHVRRFEVDLLLELHAALE